MRSLYTAGPRGTRAVRRPQSSAAVTPPSRQPASNDSIRMLPGRDHAATTPRSRRDHAAAITVHGIRKRPHVLMPFMFTASSPGPRCWLGTVALALLPLAAAAVPDTLAQRLQACTVCHGAQGRATADGYFPRLAGKPADYLNEQLLAFRDGRRQHSGMARLLADLPDAYLREMAAHFAALELPYPAPAPARGTPAERARGEQLVRRGDPSRQLPACASCHGDRLAGRLPAMPALTGLSADYLQAQFGAWRNGTRKARAPDCMADVARRLRDDEPQAIAAYLAAQAADARSMKPDAPSAAPLPLACGGVAP